MYSKPIGEPAISRAERRDRGLYYTPPEVVSLVLDAVLESSGWPLPPVEGPFHVLDFACGAGEFLVQATERLRGRVSATILGLDVDAEAVTIARRRLVALDAQFPINQIQVGDALDDGRLERASFDCILGNPPYISIRQLAKSVPCEQLTRWQARYRSARGNFDLYTLFIERALELLRPGGRCGLVVPNKWATLDYARTCRQLLLAQATIGQVIDLTHAKVFSKANVYPHILVFTKGRAAATHTIRVSDATGRPSHAVLQSAQTSAAIRLQAALNVESRVPTIPLDKVARLACGTAGFTASRLAPHLVDNTTDSREDAAHFITTSSIDRYRVRLGNVRYLGHTYVRPRLPLNSAILSAAKRQLFGEQKIVIAGMSRRLEAAWDAQGLALGVQVFAARDFSVDPFYLLALLNSKLLSYLFATRFAGKRLAGGYLAINKGQLAQLPVRHCSSTSDNQLARQLANLAIHWTPSADEQIDRLTCALYGLSEHEVQELEDHFRPQRSVAA